MVLTRRNTLVLLLTVIAAAGVIGGTGAFSTVEADRTVEVNTAGDTNANVQFVLNDNPDNPSLTDTDDDDGTIGFDFDNMNLNANTTYDKALNVTINDAQADSSNYKIEAIEEPDGVHFEFDGQDSIEIGGGETAQADITVDTSDDGIDAGDTSGDGVDSTVTFEVTAQ